MIYFIFLVIMGDLENQLKGLSIIETLFTIFYSIIAASVIKIGLIIFYAFQRAQTKKLLIPIRYDFQIWKENVNTDLKKKSSRFLPNINGPGFRVINTINYIINLYPPVPPRNPRYHPVPPGTTR